MSRMAVIWREPLAHFLLIGTALFVFYSLTTEPVDDSRNRIVVDAGQVEQIAAQFSRTWLRPPTEVELERLVAAHVRDEVFYREALAMGLDRDDPIVRQRLKLKLEFLLEDLTEIAPADDAALSVFLSENADRFMMEPEITFRQVYLNPERHADLGASVGETLARLRAGDEPVTLSDSTMIPVAFEAATPTQIARNFGQEFALELSVLRPGGWQGPISSGLGVHLVEISDRTDGRLPSLEEIRSVVEREWLSDRREALDELAFEQLKQGYEVVIEPFDPAIVIRATNAGAGAP